MFPDGSFAGLPGAGAQPPGGVGIPQRDRGLHEEDEGGDPLSPPGLPSIRVCAHVAGDRRAVNGRYSERFPVPVFTGQGSEFGRADRDLPSLVRQPRDRDTGGQRAVSGGFFREATGPGWVLVGDAGHFKDPAPGQGIQDAFRQVEFLAAAILGAINDSPSALDKALAGWARWRDHDAAEHYWLAVDLGKAGSAPAVLPEIAQRLYERGKGDSFTDLFNHRSLPSKVLSPPRLLAATTRLLARGGCDRRALLSEVGGLLAQDVRRKRLARHPHYVPLETSVDAGPTEVEVENAVGLR